MTHTIRTVLAAALLLLAVPALAADKVAERRYPLPDRGSFNMNVPAAWKDEVSQPPQAPPTIKYVPAAGQPFEILVTPLWRPRPDLPPPTKAMTREAVEQFVKSVQRDGVEGPFNIVEFQGKSGTGYYFLATDKSAKAGDYKFLTQGMLVVSELAVGFTILTNDNQARVVRDALAMLRSAVHVPK